MLPSVDETSLGGEEPRASKIEMSSGPDRGSNSTHGKDGYHSSCTVGMGRISVYSHDVVGCLPTAQFPHAPLARPPREVVSFSLIPPRIECWSPVSGPLPTRISVDAQYSRSRKIRQDAGGRCYFRRKTKSIDAIIYHQLDTVQDGTPSRHQQCGYQSSCSLCRDVRTFHQLGLSLATRGPCRVNSSRIRRECDREGELLVISRRCPADRSGAPPSGPRNTRSRGRSSSVPKPWREGGSRERLPQNRSGGCLAGQCTREGKRGRLQWALAKKRLKGRRSGRSNPGPEVFSVALKAVQRVQPLYTGRPRFQISCR